MPKNDELIGNLRKWIEERLEKDEIIEAVVIGDNFREADCPKQIPAEKRYKPISWEEAKELIDYDFYADFGSPRCHAIYVWTNKRVFFVGEYDGTTWLDDVPRNPEPCVPDYK